MSAYANAYFLSFVVKQKQIKVKLVLPAGVSKLYLISQLHWSLIQIWNIKLKICFSLCNLSVDVYVSSNFIFY